MTQIDTTAIINGVRLVELGSHPSAPSNGFVLLHYISGSNSGLYVELPNGASIGPFITGSSGGAGFTPSHYEVPILAPDSNTNFSTISNSLATAYYLLSGGSQNDSATWNINLPAGTYKWVLFHYAGNDRGVYHLLLDGNDLATIDGYAGSAAVAVSTATGITVPGASPTAVQIKMATKNGSSGGYYGLSFWMFLIRTGP